MLHERKMEVVNIRHRQLQVNSLHSTDSNLFLGKYSSD